MVCLEPKENENLLFFHVSLEEVGNEVVWILSSLLKMDSDDKERRSEV